MWKRSAFGGSEYIDLADGKGRLGVSMTHTRPCKYRGVFSLESRCTNKETSDQAKSAILQIARKRLAQALAEVDALIKDSE